MRIAGLSILALTAFLVWQQPTDFNLVCASLGGLGLAFLGIGSMGHERKRR
jgi:hypothetical protein